MMPLLALAPVSCKKPEAKAPPKMPPATVTFVPAASEKVSLSRDLPGRVDAIRTSEIRARVPGILLQRTFDEGSNVKAGQVLFKIDPAPTIAARAVAVAAKAKAEAALLQAQTQANRYLELIKVKAISQQEVDNANAAVQTAKAELLSTEATIQTADLNLGYATVTAPIDGRIGKALVTEGALVGQGDVTKLAVIQQLDPIYVDFTESSTDLLAQRKAMQEGKVDKETGSQVKLILDDGTEYAQPGKVLFSEVTVDETTGMVSLRAQFPNPDHDLLPGLFARVRVTQTLKEDSVTVPQQAVTRNADGSAKVLVVGEDKKLQSRTIMTGASFADKWVVTTGLKAGEHVIMEGVLSPGAQPGAVVNPEPYGKAKDAKTVNKGES